MNNEIKSRKQNSKKITNFVKKAFNTKKEIMHLIASEVRQFLDNIEADKLIKKIIAGSIIEVSASIKFVDKETKLNSKNKIK